MPERIADNTGQAVVGTPPFLLHETHFDFFNLTRACARETKKNSGRRVHCEPWRVTTRDREFARAGGRPTGGSRPSDHSTPHEGREGRRGSAKNQHDEGGPFEPKCPNLNRIGCVKRNLIS